MINNVEAFKYKLIKKIITLNFKIMLVKT